MCLAFMDEAANRLAIFFFFFEFCLPCLLWWTKSVYLTFISYFFLCQVSGFVDEAANRLATFFFSFLLSFIYPVFYGGLNQYI